MNFKQFIEEKKLTKAELKKREEIAKAIERDNPGMPMDKKMAIATATAKKVAEEVEQLEEMQQGKSYSKDHIEKKIRSGDWEAVTDIKPGKHVELRHHSGKRVQVHVKESVELEEAAKLIKKNLVDVNNKHGQHVSVYHHEPEGMYVVKHMSGSSKIKDVFSTNNLAAANAAAERHLKKLKESVDMEHLEESDNYLVYAKVDDKTKTFRVRGATSEADAKKKFERHHASTPIIKIVKESVEQIEELSKQTLGSYAKKASASAAGLATTAMHHKNTAAAHFQNAAEAPSKDLRRSSERLGAEFSKYSTMTTDKQIQRQKGVAKAIDRLTKEETVEEQMKDSTSDKIAAWIARKITGDKQTAMLPSEKETQAKEKETERKQDAAFRKKLYRKSVKESTHVEEGYVVHYYNNKGEKQDGSSKVFKDETAAKKHAERGNKVDKVGGSYKVHKISDKGHLEEAKKKSSCSTKMENAHEDDYDDVTEGVATDWETIQKMDKGNVLSGKKDDIKKRITYLNAVHAHNKKHGKDTLKTRKEIERLNSHLTTMKESQDMNEQMKNPFDWKGYIEQRKKEKGTSSPTNSTKTGHEVKKTSTGTVYTKKASASGEYADHDEKKASGEEPVKRGRGRPKGSYGSYKARSAETNARAAAKSAASKAANRAKLKEAFDEEFVASLFEDFTDEQDFLDFEDLLQCEEFDQLDELSQNTLASYFHKAIADRHSKDLARDSAKRKGDDETADKLGKKVYNRSVGLEKAKDKFLARESEETEIQEVEQQLDESVTKYANFLARTKQ